MSDYTASFAVNQSPAHVFAAINDVRGWWGTDVEGANGHVGDEFTYRVQDIHYSKIRVVERVENQRIVWLVLDNHMSFVQDQSEWVGTRIIFEIEDRGQATEVRFTHQGLTPVYECYDVCSDAWGSLMRSSLPDFITTGRGHPYT